MQTRTLEYTLLPPIGTDSLHRRGSVSELVQATPNLLFLGYVPPLNVLNNVFQKGQMDAGMSGGTEWEPFQISLQEYEDLITELRHTPHLNLKFVRPPEQITEFEQWWQWVIKQLEPDHTDI